MGTNGRTSGMHRCPIVLSTRHCGANAPRKRAIADGMRDPEAKRKMLSIAASYDRLAERPEYAPGLPKDQMSVAASERQKNRQKLSKQHSASARLPTSRVRSTQIGKSDQSLASFVPQCQAHAAKALHQRDSAKCLEFGMLAQHVWESVKGDSTAQVMYVMHTNIGGEPTQNARQLVVGTAMKRCLVQVPRGLVCPKRLLELMLDVEEPNADGRRQQGNRQMDE